MKEITMVQMDNKTEAHKARFEVLEVDESKVTFKRVVSPKGRKAKELHRIEMGLPKVTLTFFTDDDLNRLRILEGEISGRLVASKKSKIGNVLHSLKRIMLE